MNQSMSNTQNLDERFMLALLKQLELQAGAIGDLCESMKILNQRLDAYNQRLNELNSTVRSRVDKTGVDL